MLYVCLCVGVFFFFKQKTAYEMRISDWSSDVCSSDLLSSLRLMGTGSAAIPAWAIDGIEREFGIEIINFFGSNEGTSLLSTPREVPDPAMRATLFPRFGRPEFDWPTFPPTRSEEHTSELQSLMRISYAVFCLKNKNTLQH